MELTDKLTAIADGFRASRKITEELTLDRMATLAAERTEDIIQHADIPSYVKKEALEVAQKVRSVQTDDSIVFLAMSDSHYYGTQGESGVDGYVDGNGTQGNISNLHGAMGAKILAYALDFDFIAHLGDATWGHKTTTSELLNSQVDTLFDMLRESHANLPCFHAIGNHDTGLYYHNEMISKGNTGVYTETGENLYNKFTALSASDDTVFGDKTYGGYCYRDFADKKLRVFLLNSCDNHVYNQTDGTMLGSQRLWFANALLDLNSKSDASKWGYIVLCHYPADYGGMMPFSELLKAYIEGGSITISVEDGTSSTVSFSGKNSARFIVQLHGHVHNFKTSKLHSYATGKGVQYDAWRMCIPNGQYNRENYYSTVGSYTDIDFSENENYPKTVDTAKDTSFVVNVINPSEEKIYSFCYGAGYDRVVGYAATVYYSITKNLANVTSDNTTVSIEEGKAYSEIITLASGYDMKTITVTMGGVDISSSAISIVDGAYHISIPEVTGNIIITAKAQAHPNFTNLVPLSINSDGSDYYVDGDGYDNDMYIGSGGSPSALAGYTATGFISVNEGKKIIRLAGDGISVDTTYTRFAFYNSNFEKILVLPYSACGNGEYNPKVIEESSTVVTIETGPTTAHNGSSGVYMRVCTKGDGANLIVTVDEEITYGGNDTPSVQTYTVTNNMVNCTNNNPTVTSVEHGAVYATLITANSGYTLSNVTVTMGGVDITDDVCTTGEIGITVGITSVTGNIVITAVANAVGASYTNQLPISTDTDGTTFNSVGYKADSYLSSGNVGSKTGYYTTGFIPCTAGDTLYFKNVQLQDEQSYHRIAMYNSSKTYITNSQCSTTNENAAHYVLTFGSDGNIVSLTIPTTSSYGKQASYIRFCCSGLDGTSIVTVNEEIV